MNDYPWLKVISRESDLKLRRFTPEWNSFESIWVISICPPFENCVRNGDEIPSDISGIYRYRRGDEIVYIGRGSVRSRSNDPIRENWDFDAIDYSIVPNETKQEKWESFWLDYYKEKHDGKLPIYNRIAGKRLNHEIG